MIAEVYKHYRGENLPDPEFFDNALTDTFSVPVADLTGLWKRASEVRTCSIDIPTAEGRPSHSTEAVTYLRHCCGRSHATSG
jgi:hypothetical protein